MDDDNFGRAVHWDGRKWPNELHWQFEMTMLGEDSHGAWLVVPSGALVRRGVEDAFRLPDGFVSVVPHGAWWTGEFYLTHPELEVYVNIGTPCEWGVGFVRQIDLDLDVIRTRSGSVETVDEDEFIDHQKRFRYPPELIDGARNAAREATTLLEQRVEPFDRAAQPWLELARGLLKG